MGTLASVSIVTGIGSSLQDHCLYILLETTRMSPLSQIGKAHSEHIAFGLP
jgi:hypothetical protein